MNSTVRILALDLGKFRSVACALDPVAGTHQFQTIATTPAAVHELLVAQAPATLVIEACSVSGWICDLADTLGITVRVANTNGEAWKWRRVKRKTDRDDALKLARLHAGDQLPTVHVPKLEVRQHRALIKYRHGLVDRRTGVKNTIRSLLDAQGLSLPARSRGWTKEAIAELATLSRPLAQCEMHELWRGQLAMELTMLEQLQRLIKELDAKLDALQASDDRMRRLKTIPQVGNRLAELVVVTLDEAERFASAAQVSAYAGLVPRQYQSGQMNRLGRITGQGPGLLRRVLVQVAWGLARREGTHGHALFERLCHGQRTRRKQAAVALARKILVWCWAILRDGSEWDEGRRLKPCLTS
ncbi:MAG TPA: IS110 family transposase [Sphingomonas sp.]|jgi:transposase